jgi:hypothetical protein
MRLQIKEKQAKMKTKKLLIATMSLWAWSMLTPAAWAQLINKPLGGSNKEIYTKSKDIKVAIDHLKGVSKDTLANSYERAAHMQGYQFHIDIEKIDDKSIIILKREKMRRLQELVILTDTTLGTDQITITWKQGD